MAKKIFKILPDSQPNKQKRCGSNGLSSSAMDTLGRLVSAENVQLPPYRALRYSDCGKSLHYGQILWLLRGYDRDRAVYTAAFASQYMSEPVPRRAVLAPQIHTVHGVFLVVGILIVHLQCGSNFLPISVDIEPEFIAQVGSSRLGSLQVST